MPIPEDLLVYGRTDLLVPVAHRQPAAGAVPAFNNPDRAVTRSVAFHYSAGWIYHGWNLKNGAWLGTAYNIDLDGTLFQCTERARRTAHIYGAPHFLGSNLTRRGGLIGGARWRGHGPGNATAVGVEVCRFGSFNQSGANFHPRSYNRFIFRPAAEPANGICDYSRHPPVPGGTAQFNLRLMRGGTLISRRVRGYEYFAKVHDFTDSARNSKGVASGITHDSLFTEEQHRTMIYWAKAMCEMFRVPKRYLLDPATGRPNPWIADHDVVGLGRGEAPPRNDARYQERLEQVASFQGIYGHVSLQRNRIDPGPAVDYYRIQRGISDEWWLPVGGARALDYLDQSNVSAYAQLTRYRDESDIDTLMSQVERGQAGFFPFGENRVWHGGIHVDGDGPVHTMANGRVVCARVTNGPYDFDGAPDGTEVSRCFVLVRHDVHVRDELGATSAHWEGPRDLIDYGEGSTRVFYTLYMHLEPYHTGAAAPPGARSIGQDAQGRHALDWDRLPWWLNRYLVKNPQDTALQDGGLIFPDEPIELGDVVGWRGTYITGKGANGTPRFGTTAHIELFTLEDPASLRGSPWEQAGNRIEDPNDGMICEPDLVDQLILDIDRDGWEARDIRDALPSLRTLAVRYRSEWSLTDPSQLGRHLVSWWGLQTRALGEVVSQAAWQSDIAPLMFYDEMVAGSTEQVIGPFYSDRKVWHLHPLTFMRWMNARVDAHEAVLRGQTKLLPRQVENLTLDGDYVVGWQNLGGAAPATLAQNTGQTYPEACHAGNGYEVPVDRIADQTALTTSAQTQTRFHLALLDYLDLINDSLAGLTVLRAWETQNGPGDQALHHAGHAVLVAPETGSDMTNWYRFVQDVESAQTVINAARAESLSTAWGWTDRTGARSEAITARGQEMARRIAAAANPTDAVLTTPPIDAADLSDMAILVWLQGANRRVRVTFDRIVIHMQHAVSSMRWTQRFFIGADMLCFLDRHPIGRGNCPVPLPAPRNARDLVLSATGTGLVLSAESPQASVNLLPDRTAPPAECWVAYDSISEAPQSVTFGPDTGEYVIEATVVEL